MRASFLLYILAAVFIHFRGGFVIRDAFISSVQFESLAGDLDGNLGKVQGFVGIISSSAIAA